MMICWAFLDKNKVVAESWNNLEEVPVPSVTSQKTFRTVCLMEKRFL